MAGFIDLHCHWLPGVDDGVRDDAEGLALLRGLRALGFDVVHATPHMRPGMFDNTAQELRAAFEDARLRFGDQPGLPRLALACEHYLDELVLERILSGQALPYPGGRSVLIELYDVSFSPALEQRLFEVQRRGVLPVLAHPERYRPLWDSPEKLERLTQLGSAALLDIAALTGKYGQRPQRTARALLEAGVYHAACTDAHHPRDLDDVEDALRWLTQEYGRDELDFLLREGPEQLLAGTQP